MAHDLIMKLKLIFLLIANLLSVLTLVHSLLIYTSLIPFLPWHDPCGMQFIILWFLDFKVLMAITILSVFLGKYFGASFLARYLPILAGFGILIIFADQTLPFYLLTIGSLICIGFIILIIYFGAKDIKNIRSSFLKA